MSCVLCIAHIAAVRIKPSFTPFLRYFAFIKPLRSNDAFKKRPRFTKFLDISRARIYNEVKAPVIVPGGAHGSVPGGEPPQQGGSPGSRIAGYPFNLAVCPFDLAICPFDLAVCPGVGSAGLCSATMPGLFGPSG